MPSSDLLEFEEPVGILLKEIEALRLMPQTADRLASIARLEARITELRVEIYAKPEGYGKARRVMKRAEKFSLPILVFGDTPAAYPGIESEERGVAEAIALNLREMALLDVPIVVLVCGEGGSGGALGIAVGDRVLMQEFTIYSVIPPEGCAAILWRDSKRKVEAAAALKITAPDLLKMELIDEIVAEPPGGAHNDYDGAAALVDAALTKHLSALSALAPATLV